MAAPRCFIPTLFLHAAIFSICGGMEVELGADGTDMKSEPPPKPPSKAYPRADAHSKDHPIILHDNLPEVSSIEARGTKGKFKMWDELKPSQYELSKPASEYGLTEENAFRPHGGGEEWKLFPPPMSVPEELPGDASTEYMRINDPGDTCMAGDISGYSILNVSNPTLLPYIVPKDKPGRKPLAMIIAPGGGCRYLSWNKEGTNIALWLNSLGISAFVLKYRVPTNTPETEKKSLIDGQRAVSLVRSSFASLGVEKVGMIGFSAGGFLAADVSVNHKRSYEPLDEVDQHSPVPDFAMLVYDSGAGRGGPNAVDTPPTTFIAIARNDNCIKVTDALDYFETLLSAEEEHEIHVFGSGKHGYGDCDVFVMGDKHDWKPVCAWTLNAQLFIERQLGVTQPIKHVGQSMTVNDEFATSAADTMPGRDDSDESEDWQDVLDSATPFWEKSKPDYEIGEALIDQRQEGKDLWKKHAKAKEDILKEAKEAQEDEVTPYFQLGATVDVDDDD